MISNFVLSRFIVLRLLKFVKADTIFTQLFKALFSSVPPLIRTVGIIPVSFTIWSLYGFLRSGLTIGKFPMEVLERLNPVAVKAILDIISPYWNICIKQQPFFLNIFRVFSGFFIFGLFRPICFKLIKILTGLTITSIGISFNEALSAITILKTISDYILSYVPGLNIGALIENSKISKSLNINKSLPISNNELNTLKDGSSLLSILGLIVMGAGTVVIILFAGEYFAPSITHSIPGVETFMNSLRYTFLNIYLWWNPNYLLDTPSPIGGSLGLPDPESISRTSSTGTITLKDIRDITPRPTAPNSPTLFPSDQSSDVPALPADFWN